MLVGKLGRVNRRTGHAFLVFTFVVIGKFVYKEVLNRKTQQVKRQLIDSIFTTVFIEE
jgi:hypothetical protein